MAEIRLSIRLLFFLNFPRTDCPTILSSFPPSSIQRSKGWSSKVKEHDLELSDRSKNQQK